MLVALSMRRKTKREERTLSKAFASVPLHKSDQQLLQSSIDQCPMELWACYQDWRQVGWRQGRLVVPEIPKQIYAHYGTHLFPQLKAKLFFHSSESPHKTCPSHSLLNPHPKKTKQPHPTQIFLFLTFISFALVFFLLKHMYQYRAIINEFRKKLKYGEKQKKLVSFIQ